MPAGFKAATEVRIFDADAPTGKNHAPQTTSNERAGNLLANKDIYCR